MISEDDRSADAAGSSADSGQALRQRAEDLAREKAVQSPEDLEALSPEEARRLIHELSVHQIELEIQNEDLRRAQTELDAVRARYFDLYDLAPVGYCTISEKGLILEVNLTAAIMLGVARGELARQPFTRFIHRDDQDIYYLYRKQIFETHPTGAGRAGTSQVCELRMVKQDGATFWARLEAAVAPDPSKSSGQGAGSAPTCRVVMIDITERMQMEEALRASEAEHRQQAQEKARLVREVNHRVGNNLALLLAMVNSALVVAAAPETRDALQNLQGRLQSIAEVHRLLSGAQWMPLGLEQLAEQVIYEALDSAPMQSRIHCQVHSSGEPVYVTPKQAFKLALIFNELTTNSIKYAFKERGVGQIRVEIAANGPWVQVAFGDDGPGWPASVLAGRRQNIGLSLVRTIMEGDMRGEIALRNEGGAMIECRFALETTE